MRYARYVLGVMVAINFLNYMDRWVASAASPLIQKEFGLNDSEVGLLGSAFLLVYAVAAIPFGYWADRGVRKVVIGVGVAIWSVATLATGFARNYAALFISRSVLGIGEAGYYPAGTSLLSDFFPKQLRARVMSIWGAGSTIGIAVGFAGGGYIADKFGWRDAFFFAAAPGILCAILIFAIREPLRGAMEKGPSVERTADASFRMFFNLMRIPTLRATIIAQTLLYFVLASNAFWLPILLNRRFAMTVSQAGLLAGVVIVLGGLVGTLGGGWIADHYAKKSPAAHLQVGIAGFLAGAVFIVIALVGPLTIGAVPIFVPAFFLGVVAIYLYSGPFTALSQAVVTPGLRASAVTVLLFVSHVFGDSHSTFDIGWLSDNVTHSLQIALLITSPTLLVIAAIAAATGLRTAKPDVDAMENEWASRETAQPALATGR